MLFKLAHILDNKTLKSVYFAKFYRTKTSGRQIFVKNFTKTSQQNILFYQLRTSKMKEILLTFKKNNR